MSPANLWIGTRGTVTSLHSDPSDNLLCQVAGFKYFRLYALDQTPLLHATTLRAKNTNSFGTSPVRLEAPLPPEHASVAQAEYIEGLLAPGDMLFLPKSMWHYVRSLTTSVSVNFWF
jgi:lysine-specific demethylase 8